MNRSPDQRAAEAAMPSRREPRAADASSHHAGVAMPACPGRGDPSTFEIGAEAEGRAVAFLVARRYEIVERNYRCKVGELDIVARDGDTLVFVEVKSRTDDDWGDAFELVGRHKRRQVTRAAQVYLEARRPDFDEVRFDVVAINGDEIDLYEDAWRGGLL